MKESSCKVDVFTHFLLTAMSVEALETFPNPHNSSGVSQGKPPPKANTTEVTLHSEKTNIMCLHTFSTLLALCPQAPIQWHLEVFFYFLLKYILQLFSEEQNHLAVQANVLFPLVETQQTCVTMCKLCLFIYLFICRLLRLGKSLSNETLNFFNPFK